ncbi:31911_t:CDS:2 [Gigaspora margarita]|uniref:31911_t:CDS:1 n=1 Tax=Gigaspora margarita TaxID=4874 RepID=A0ABN7VAY8_GIGMA|nr:31911_t:CDS:2 [Gigaspora margarita]
MVNRIRVTEITLNESEMKVLTGDNLKEAEKRKVLQRQNDKSIEPIVTKTNLNIESKDKIQAQDLQKLDIALVILVKSQLQNGRISTKQEQFSSIYSTKIRKKKI